MASDEILHSMGPAGYFIGMMATAVTALAAGNVFQYKHSNKVYGYRLAERDTLRDALNASAKAIEAQNRASEERNRVTEELADAMRALSGSFDKLTERLAMQHEHGRDKASDQTRQLEKLVEVFAANADAVRNNTAIVTDVRNSLEKRAII